MNRSTLGEIEEAFDRLSTADQLLVIERLVRRTRQHSSPIDIGEDDLARMAEDPEIQLELKQIEAEFAYTELDGLEGS